MDDRRLHERLEEILPFDLVVIVRGRLSPEMPFARDCSIATGADSKIARQE